METDLIVTYAIVGLVAFIAVVILFAVLRALWCWYFRINEIVNLLQLIANRLDTERKEEVE